MFKQWLNYNFLTTRNEKNNKNLADDIANNWEIAFTEKGKNGEWF